MTRTLLFAALFQSAGAVFFGVLYGESLQRTAPSIVRVARAAATAGIVLVALHQVLDAARMAGSLAGVIDAQLERLAWQGAGGVAALLQIGGLSLIIVGLRAGRPVAAVVGAVVGVIAGVLIGHTSVHRDRVLLAPLLALHLLLVAFWFGALLPLMLCCRREPRDTAVDVLRAFSAQAGYLVPCLGLAGACMALILLPHRTDWLSEYALFILAKMGAFAVLLLIAAWNRWRAVPAVAHSTGEQAVGALQRFITIEYALIVAVMGLTATMTASYSPP